MGHTSRGTFRMGPRSNASLFTFQVTIGFGVSITLPWSEPTVTHPRIHSAVRLANELSLVGQLNVAG